VYRGYGDAVLETVTGPLLGHVQVQHPDWRADRAMDLTVGELDRVVAGLRTLEAVEVVAPRVIGPVLAAESTRTRVAVAYGIDVAAERARGGLLADLDGLERPAGRRVLVGAVLARTLGVEPGAQVALVGQTFDGFIANDLYTVAGVISSPVDLVNTHGVVMSLAEAQRLFEMPGRAHQLVVRGPPGTDAPALAAAAARLPALAGTEIVPWQEVVPLIATMTGVLDKAGYFIIGLLFIAAIAGITNTLMMSTFERMHEFGMLLGLGCGPGRIVRMVFAEAVLLGLLGVVCGTVLGLLTVLGPMSAGVDVMGTSGTTDVTIMGMQWTSIIYPRTLPGDAVAGLIAVTLTSLLAASWPASLAARLEPMEAMRA
jgi:ABC-type lipoprotein release transport system permease subunit